MPASLFPQSALTKIHRLNLREKEAFTDTIVNHVSFLFAANLLEGVTVEVVGRRPDEPSEFVALTNETIILYVDVTFLVGVDL